ARRGSRTTARAPRPRRRRDRGGGAVQRARRTSCQPPGREVGESDIQRTRGAPRLPYRRWGLPTIGVAEPDEGRVDALRPAKLRLAQIDRQRRRRSHMVATGSRIPAIMLTAHADDETRRRSLEAGAVAFLEKPFRSSTLLDAVRTALASA